MKDANDPIPATESTAPLGFVRLSAYDLVPISVARDVPVLPSTEIRQDLFNGGPVLPNWKHQVEVRHNRKGAMTPSTPPGVPDEMMYLDESVIWGGYVDLDTARFVAEFSTRVLPALHQRPDDRLIFALWPGGTVDDIPDLFWAVLDWYGVSHDRIYVIDQPVMVREVWIAPQPEQMDGPGPSYQLLEILADNTTARELAPLSNDIVYVPRRVEMPGQTALWIGEQYLIEKLKELGVVIFDPTGFSLRDQLAVFAGAQTLVFAEGPDLRLRQLLGFYEQDIVVLALRRNARLGSANLLPRCRRLTYGEVTEGRIRLALQQGPDTNAPEVSVYSHKSLLSVFDALAVPLRSVWDAAAFKEQVKVAILEWLESQLSATKAEDAAVDWAKSAENVRRDLKASGLSHILDDAEKLMAQANVGDT